MFDIGFWEVVLVAVVALVVVGPEKLPGFARTAGLWVGRARRAVTSLKTEIDKELKAEELREVMAKQAESAGLHEIIEETRSVVREVSTPSPAGATATEGGPLPTQVYKPADGEKE